MSIEAKIKRWIAGNKIRFDVPRRPREFNMQTRAEHDAQTFEIFGDLPASAFRLTLRPQLHQHISEFDYQTPKHRPYLYPQYGYAFTGRTAKRELNNIVGSDADYLANFMFQHKIIRKIGFGRVEGIIPDDTLYRIDQKKATLQRREIINGAFPKETAYFESRAVLRDSQN